MPDTFMTSPSLFLTSESVTEGHPDKVSDQISDSILDAIIAEDSRCRVACETLVTTGMAFISAEISTEAYVEIPDIVRRTIKQIGYDDAAYGFDYEICNQASLVSADNLSCGGTVVTDDPGTVLGNDPTCAVVECVAPGFEDAVKTVLDADGAPLPDPPEGVLASFGTHEDFFAWGDHNTTTAADSCSMRSITLANGLPASRFLSHQTLKPSALSASTTSLARSPSSRA